MLEMVECNMIGIYIGSTVLLICHKYEKATGFYPIIYW